MKTSGSLRRFRPLICAVALTLVAVGAWYVWLLSLRATIVIEAGPKGGFFHETANQILGDLNRHGIRAQIVHREDTLKIIDDVNDEKSAVAIGFMAQEAQNKEYPGVTAVGTIALEPLFIFHPASLRVRNLQDLKGLRLAVSPPASGTRAMSERILGAYGVTADNSTFLPTTLSESSEAVKKGLADAAFFLLPPGNKYILDLARDPQLRMMDLPQAGALSSNLGFVRQVTINAGAFDYVGNIPAQDVQLVAVPVTVIVKKDIKPAIVTILAQFLKTNFQNATLVSKPGELLTIHEPSIPVNSHAETVLKNGLPYIYRTLPFSGAALLDHFSLYIGLLIFVLSVYSSMNFPSPQLVWREIQLAWYLRKLERLANRVSSGQETIAPKDRQLIDKVHGLVNKEEARLRRVTKLVASLQAKAGA